MNIPITIDEHTQLLTDAPLNTTVDTTIGKPVTLIDCESNDWAIRRLAALRGGKFNARVYRREAVGHDAVVGGEFDYTYTIYGLRIIF